MTAGRLNRFVRAVVMSTKSAHTCMHVSPHFYSPPRLADFGFHSGICCAEEQFPEWGKERGCGSEMKHSHELAEDIGS